MTRDGTVPAGGLAAANSGPGPGFKFKSLVLGPGAGPAAARAARQVMAQTRHVSLRDVHGPSHGHPGRVTAAGPGPGPGPAAAATVTVADM